MEYGKGESGLYLSLHNSINKFRQKNCTNDEQKQCEFIRQRKYMWLKQEFP